MRAIKKLFIISVVRTDAFSAGESIAGPPPDQDYAYQSLAVNLRRVQTECGQRNNAVITIANFVCPYSLHYL